jgi:hypothetical protein
MKWFAPQPFRKLKKNTADALLVKPDIGSFLLRSFPRRGRMFMCGGWLADDAIGPRLTFPTRGLRASARACEGERGGTTRLLLRTPHSFKVSLRQAGRSTCVTPEPIRRACGVRVGLIIPRVPGFSCRCLRGGPQSARFCRRRAGASFPKSGLWFSGLTDARSKTLHKFA